MFTFVCLFVGVWKENLSQRDSKKAPGAVAAGSAIFTFSSPLSKTEFLKEFRGSSWKSQEVTVAGFRYQIFVSALRDLKKKHKIQKSWYLYTCYEVAESGIFWHLLNPPVCSLPVKGKTKISIKSIDHDPGDHIVLLFPVYFTASSDCRIPYMLYKLIYRPSRVFREIKDFSNSPWKCNLTLLW